MLEYRFFTDKNYGGCLALATNYGMSGAKKESGSPDQRLFCRDSSVEHEGLVPAQTGDNPAVVWGACSSAYLYDCTEITEDKARHMHPELFRRLESATP